MSADRLTVALISEVFPPPEGLARLDALLAEARGAGAELAVLPELPLNPWSPSTRVQTPWGLFSPLPGGR